MTKIYKNWLVHNVIAHPVAEMAYWALYLFSPLRASRLSMWIHDVTCPNYEHTEAK